LNLIRVMPAKGQDTMQTSLFLAKLLGPPLLIVGIGILINRDYYLALTRQFVGSSPLMYLGAVVGMVGGLAIILVHNIWVADWRVLITLLGWIHVIRGAATVIFPHKAAEFATRITARAILISTAVPLILGAVFVFFGYVR
jgi:hypothetical protein